MIDRTLTQFTIVDEYFFVSPVKVSKAEAGFVCICECQLLFAVESDQSDISKSLAWQVNSWKLPQKGFVLAFVLIRAEITFLLGNGRKIAVLSCEPTVVRTSNISSLNRCVWHNVSHRLGWQWWPQTNCIHIIMHITTLDCCCWQFKLEVKRPSSRKNVYQLPLC